MRKNRRAHPRYPVDLEAELRYGRAQTQPCRIRDLCVGGALVGCARSPEVVVGSYCEISLRQPANQAALRLACEVAHVLEGGFGVRFVHVGTGTLEALRNLLKGQAQTVANAVRTRPATASRQILNQDTVRSLLQRVTLRRLPPLVETLLRELQARLWRYGEELANATERERLLQELRLLERAHWQQRVQEGLRRALLDPIGRLGRSAESRRAVQAPKDTPLELVDTDQFEVWLSRGAMSGFLEDNLAGPLATLRNQAAQAFSEPLPVEPRGLAEGLGQVMQSLELGTPVQVLCFRFAGPLLKDMLESYYQDVIQTWEAAGLIPGAPPLTLPVSARPATRDHPDPSPEVVAPAVADVRVAEGQDRAGMTGAPPLAHGGGDSSPGSLAGGAGMLAVSQAGNLLARLPADALGPEWSGQSLKERVLDLLRGAAQEDWVPEPRLRQRLEATDRVLNRMLEDPQAALPLKDWVRRLALRFLAASMLEPHFYGDVEHPLVKLINGLEHLAQFLTPGDMVLQGELERLVAEALRSDGADLDALRAIATRASGLRGKFSGEFQRNAERVVARSEGRERLREARRLARDRLDQFLEGRQLHRVLDELVREAWWPLLQLAWLREGEQGAGWRRLWGLLTQLLEATTSPTGPDALEARRLLDQVGEELTYISFDPLRRRDLLQRLGGALRRRPGKGDLSDRVTFTPLVMDAEDTRAEATPPPGIPVEQWRQALAWVGQLSLGASVRFKDQGREQPLRLVWRSPDKAELVLVNPRGFHARTLDRSELALARLHGKASGQPPLEEPITERAELAALREMRERVSYHETHDPLTGLKNRRQLLGNLSQWLDSPVEGRHPQVLGLVDLDYFEVVSSTCGYAASEKMLLTAVSRLEPLLEAATCLAYMGGNRFGLLANAVDMAAGQELGEQICATLGDVPFHWHDKSYPMLGSLGLAWVGPESDNPEQLLSAAEAACGVARQEGGDRVVMFEDGDERIQRQRERLRWWAQAEQTVKQERLRLRAQRIAPADEANGLHHHYEVLLSVYDEQDAPLPLGAFIASAEAFNLMADLDRLVIRKTLAWLGANFDKIDRLGGLAINLSGQSLGNPDLVDYVRDRLEEFCIPPGLISFEVTETTAIANLDGAVAIIEGIQALGCRFALDDFGAGMSSYSYLKRLPVHYLKIDGSFVRDLLDNPNDQAIVRSINEIAHFMGKHTIAEFVESPALVDWLRGIGVDYLQGHAVEKPLFLDELS